MGCSGSKLDSLPLTLCKERVESIKAASEYRYVLAATHVLYFRSSKDVAIALRKVVDQQLAIGSPSPSDSPVLTLPSDIGKKKGSSSSISHLIDEDEGSHLHLSSGSDSEELDSSSNHIHIHDSPVKQKPSSFHKSHPEFDKPSSSHPEYEVPYSSYTSRPEFEVPYSSYTSRPEFEAPYSSYTSRPEFEAPYSSYTSHPDFGAPFSSYTYPPTNWEPPGSNSNIYYMKKSSTKPSTVYEDVRGSTAKVQWHESSDGYSNYPQYGNEGSFGFSMGSPPNGADNNRQYNPQSPPPAPPSPKVSAWEDFFNPFGPLYDNENYYSQHKYGSGSTTSSPDSKEVREREGIPDLEEETEHEVLRETHKEKEKNADVKVPSHHNVGTSAPVPPQYSEGTPRAPMPQHSERTSWVPPPQHSEGTSWVPPPQHSEPFSRPQHSEGGASLSQRSVGAGLQHNEGFTRASRPQRNSVSSSEVTSRTEPSEKTDSYYTPTQAVGSPDTTKSKHPEEEYLRNKGASFEGSKYSEEEYSRNKGVSFEGSKLSEEEYSRNKGVSFEGSQHSEEEYSRNKGASFEGDEVSTLDAESSKPGSFTTLSSHGTRDFQEVIEEISNEFEIAFGQGKEVSVLLEVGKLPYQRRDSVLKAIFSRILYLIAPSMSSSETPSGRSMRLDSNAMKMATNYGGPGKDFNMKRINLSSTLEQLYLWEKKLHKEVKGEERLRIMYDKKCKKLKLLDRRGAESPKIDAIQASIKILLKKINIHVRTIEAISSRMHKLRDEVLQPQLTELIHGLIRMWKSMLQCHKNQFQAIIETKSRTLKVANNSTLKAIDELKFQLLNWCNRFDEWIRAQKSYVKVLNDWLLMCLDHEPEETADGFIPFSPSRIGAPPIFTICNDWYQAMERISESRVLDAMRGFASYLHDFLEEQQLQSKTTEFVHKDFAPTLSEKKFIHKDFDPKKPMSMVPSVDLDEIKKRVELEKKDSTSIQDGLIPIFEALGDFSSQALKAHEQVRIQISGLKQ